MIDLIRSIVLGIVEGLTEFLPISSTGHLRLCEPLLGIDLDDAFWKMFTIFIQIGAIAAVVVYFKRRIVGLLRGAADALDTNLLDAAAVMPLRRGVAAPPAAGVQASRVSPLLLVAVGTVPVLIIGYLTHKWVESHLEEPFPIAMALGIGGVIMIVIELARPAPVTGRIEEMSLLQGLWVGCVQVLSAVFPGTSRSAATIIGGMAGGMSREAAAEFSFFLAIPAMTAATGYSLLKHIRSHHGMSAEQWLLLAVGTIVSFLVAWVVIALFMNYVRRRSFIPFAVYRIILAVVVLVVLKKQPH